MSDLFDRQHRDADSLVEGWCVKHGRIWYPRHGRETCLACGIDGGGIPRFCWNCGASLGLVEDRFYDRKDTCGSRLCERALTDEIEAEREERHREIDDDYRW